MKRKLGAYFFGFVITIFFILHGDSFLSRAAEVCFCPTEGPAVVPLYEAPSLLRSKYANTRVFPSPSVDQTEISIAASVSQPDRLLIGSNVNFYSGNNVTQRAGYYHSQSSASSWDGADVLPLETGISGDPAVAFR